jgi:serine/threonine-protein kinase
MESQSIHRPTSPGGRGVIRSLLMYAVLIFGAFLAGAFLFNAVIMPAFVGHREEVRVPNLIGKDLAKAEALLSKAGLKLGDTRQRHDPRPGGTIIFQQPPGGAAVKQDRAVAVVLSLGEKRSEVPDLKGETLRSARTALESAGLTLGQVFKIPSDDVEGETIIATEPSAGSPAARGVVVNLLLSSGRRGSGYMMPDLRGMEAAEVESRLTEGGFRVEWHSAGIPSRHRRVVEQDPLPGARVWPGSTIRLRSN